MDDELKKDIFEISALKGLPLTILALMTRVASPMTQAQIARDLRSDPKTVRVHLEYLERGGYMEHLENGRWSLCRRDVPLPDLWAASGTEALETGDETEEQGESPPVLRTTVGKSFVDGKNGRKVSTVQEDSGNGRLSKELIAAFKAASIRRFKWKELAGKEHVTPEYVLGQYQRVKNHPDPKKRTTNFLVHCIECGDPLPELCPNCNETLPAHSRDCYLRFQSEGDAGLVEY
jgi:hypothetical protein